jgi:hypothetical protein
MSESVPTGKRGNEGEGEGERGLSQLQAAGYTPVRKRTGGDGYTSPYSEQSPETPCITYTPRNNEITVLRAARHHFEGTDAVYVGVDNWYAGLAPAPWPASKGLSYRLEDTGYSLRLSAGWVTRALPDAPPAGRYPLVAHNDVWAIDFGDPAEVRADVE